MQSAALQWYLDQGVDVIVGDAPVDRYRAPEVVIAKFEAAPQIVDVPKDAPLQGAAEGQKQAVALANAAEDLDELRAAIEAFDGLEIKKTASQIVFGDGNPKARVMVIGEAPAADEDRQGRPFAGAGGQLLDRIFGAIGLDRAEGFYVTNLLNWRPPGNRSPTPAEIAVSLPFLERHIALAAPDFIVLLGGVAAKALTGRAEGISRLRKAEHIYEVRSEGLVSDMAAVPMVATYHTDYLLQTPLQKRAVWSDMLGLQARLNEKTGQAG